MSSSLYFAYGSNIWLDQMRRRCPDSHFVGIGILSGWKWIICERGYATIVKSEDDHVYGMIYTLTPKDEKVLDQYEHVPESYIKEILPLQLEKARGQGPAATAAFNLKEIIDALVYIDVKRVTPGLPREEYIERINKAVADGIQNGIPEEYFEKYIRPFIPAQ